MSTPPRTSAAARAAAAGLAAAVVLAACGAPEPAPSPEPSPPGEATATPPPGGPSRTPRPGGPTPPPLQLPQVSADLVGDLQGLLDARAGAVLADDRDAFLAGLAPTDDLRTTEGGYYDNLAQLPLSTFSYQLLPASLVRSGNAYWGVVEVVTQLSPYDVLPVRSLDRFRFAPARRGAFRITSTTDAAWEAANTGLRQPWDTEPVRVIDSGGVLGVFDTASDREAEGVVASVQRGVTDVATRVPYTEWGAHAVVYALNDPRFLDGFEELPGGDPQALDGVAFTVPTGIDDGTGGTDGATGAAGGVSVASTRFALSPDLLPAAAGRRPDAALDRLVRHELVHVALGDRDDDSPVWLSEGVAEWVSAQALAPEERDVPERALAAADRGIREMPSDESFNDDDAAVHYALSWWVCEWLAQTYGPDAPWTVMEAFTLRADDDQDVVLRELLGFSVDKLAKRGAQLMAATYAPAPATPAPTAPVTPTPGG